MADKALASFQRGLLERAKSGCLYDVVNSENRDASIRPNQVIAISLTNTMVSKERAASVLRVIERELLTPRGLRTFSPADPNYIGRYEGGPGSRDGAYHQGTVWPWLIGPYITAYTRTFGKKAGQRIARLHGWRISRSTCVKPVWARCRKSSMETLRTNHAVALHKPGVWLSYFVPQSRTLINLRSRQKPHEET